jgi:hypothetical protein
MDEFALRPVEKGFELSGGKLEQPMAFRERDAQVRAIQFVGYLSQKNGSALRILNAEGSLVRERHFEGVIPLEGAVGGLPGPS